VELLSHTPPVDKKSRISQSDKKVVGFRPAQTLPPLVSHGHAVMPVSTQNPMAHGLEAFIVFRA